MKVTLRAAGPRDPAEVWERYVEPRAWSQWSPQVRMVSTTQRLRPGLRGRVNGLLPFLIVAVDETARTWSWVAGRGRFTLHLEHVVTATAGGGCVTTLTVAGPGWLVAPYLPLAQVALHRLVR